MLLVEWNYYPTRLIPVVEIKLFHFSDFAVHGSGGVFLHLFYTSQHGQHFPSL
jgi:hypothetical protein